MKLKSLLKSTLLLCALVAGNVSAWGEDVTVATATFDGKNATYTEGWSTTGTGNSRTDCIIIGSGENITSPAFDLSGYSKVTITFTGRRYGTLSGSKATVDVSIGGSSQGTIDITNGSVGAVSGDINFEPTSSMTAAVLVFTCTNATSAGSTHGAGIGSITIKGTPISGDPSAPAIDADDVVIEYDATSGTIESTINNPVVGGVLTAVEKVDADWLTLGEVSGTDVPFTTTTNDGATDRVATITLTYTYNTSETVTKDVTVTQKCFPLDCTIDLNNTFFGTSYDGSLSADEKAALKSGFGYVEGTKNRVNVQYKINSSSNFYINNEQVRVYDGTSFVVTAPEGYILTSISFVEPTSGKSWAGTHTSTPAGYDGTNKKWTGAAGSVEISFGGTCRIVGINVELSSAATINLASACTDCDNYYATFSIDRAFVVPADLAVSTVQTGAGSTLIRNTYSTGDVVPANTGVLVSSSTAGDHAVTLSAEAGTVKAGNMLKPSSEAMGGGNTYYRLTMHNGTDLGFWWGADGGGSFDIAANKAYLAVPSSGGEAREGFTFGEDVTTAISAECRVQSEESANAVMYDLQGRRVSQPQKGLYISNGRKVFVK